MQIAVSEHTLSFPEYEFLGNNLKPTDNVWEWGSGNTTTVLSALCRKVTSVEHDPVFAARACLGLMRGVSVLYVPPDLPMTDPHADGDYDTFRSYVDTYTGQSIDAVLIDGRARVACARRIAETAPFGPHPGLRVFLHDFDRPEYAGIIQTEVDGKVTGWFREVSRVGRLMLMEPAL